LGAGIIFLTKETLLVEVLPKTLGLITVVVTGKGALLKTILLPVD
jgi:hypothetical protein